MESVVDRKFIRSGVTLACVAMSLGLAGCGGGSSTQGSASGHHDPGDWNEHR